MKMIVMSPGQATERPTINDNATGQPMLSTSMRAMVLSTGCGRLPIVESSRAIVPAVSDPARMLPPIADIKLVNQLAPISRSNSVVAAIWINAVTVTETTKAIPPARSVSCDPRAKAKL
jgi:hypothetical protein